MSIDYRFYRLDKFVCPRCGGILDWEHKPNTADSMMLTHGRGVPNCTLAGKSFYAPVTTLTEIPIEMLRE